MRIWFNHWFSTAYHLINLMKNYDTENFYIIGSSTNPDAIYKRTCEEWYVEPAGMEGKEYIDFCLNFCKEHKIDVFVPRRYLVEIVKNADRFIQTGVKLFADTCSETIEMLENKLKTYEFFQDKMPNLIPKVHVAHSVLEFLTAYEELSACSSRVCYKLVADEGARSFRVVDNRIETGFGLMEKPGTKITLEAAKKVLEQYDFTIPVLLMPYLSGVEISADCLHTLSGNLVIPRYKTSKRYSEVILDQEIQEICSKMMDMLKLKMPMNIQFKMNDGQLYLLEINPRMSGGLQLSCEAAGINIPNIAINQLLGINKEWSYPDIHSCKVAHIETPICLN